MSGKFQLELGSLLPHPGYLYPGLPGTGTSRVHGARVRVQVRGKASAAISLDYRSLGAEN